MNIYRVTFHGANGETFKTLLQEKTFEELKIKVGTMLNEGNCFDVEGKGNRHFYVNPKNLVFVEYEFLLDSRDTRNGIKALISQDKEYLQEVVNRLHANSALAIVIAHLEKHEKEKVLDVLSPERKLLIEKEINNLWEVSLSELYNAQEVVLETASTI
ncbi:FliG C-terminal domain-containing protein [Priestia filamentosa]|uniref:FliG C-terminal domain-containing protein n=1 Tax=Priestia filamentosa TaxID=1402861 RepID=UPI00058935AC